jgi:hypothetical protein
MSVKACTPNMAVRTATAAPDRAKCEEVYVGKGGRYVVRQPGAVDVGLDVGHRALGGGEVFDIPARDERVVNGDPYPDIGLGPELGREGLLQGVDDREIFELQPWVITTHTSLFSLSGDYSRFSSSLNSRCSIHSLRKAEAASRWALRQGGARRSVKHARRTARPARTRLSHGTPV